MNRVLPATLAILLLLSDPGVPLARERTDGTGRFRVEAELVEAKDGNVQLCRVDGTVISVPIARLSEPDRRYLASLQEDPKSGLADLTLVEDGRPVSVIVTNGRPRESQALASVELQEHLRIITGAALCIVKENELRRDPSQVLILVGPSNLANERGVNTKRLEPESFVVKTTGDALILAGTFPTCQDGDKRLKG